MIEIKDLQVHYKSFKAIKGINLELYPGEIVALIGSNGCGKSSLLRTMSGLQKPTYGYIAVDGYHSWEDRRKIWSILEYLSLDEELPGSLNAYENMELFNPHLNKEQIKVRADVIFGKDNLNLGEEHRRKKFSTLSTGMKQKVAVGALADFPYLLLDEPTQGFDPNICLQFRNYVLSNQRTVLWVTHNMLDVEDVDRAVIMKDGLFRGWGTPKILKEWTNSQNLEEVYATLTQEGDSMLVPGSLTVRKANSVEPGTCRININGCSADRLMIGPLELKSETDATLKLGSAIVNESDYEKMLPYGKDDITRAFCYKL